MGLNFVLVTLCFLTFLLLCVYTVPSQPSVFSLRLPPWGHHHVDSAQKLKEMAIMKDLNQPSMTKPLSEGTLGLSHLQAASCLWYLGTPGTHLLAFSHVSD